MRKAEPRVRILLGSVIAMGPGKADLLDAIEAEGSISAAARRMGMSYRRAWLLVDTMNQSFREPLVETAAGGKGGGGAQVTDFGRDMLTRYRDMETKARAAIVDEIDAFSEYLTPPSD